MPNVDVALVVGHHPESPGALLELEGMTVSEYDLWLPFAKELGCTMPCDTQVVTRPNQDPDEALGEKINATNAECAVELHFNSVADTSVRGCEMIHWPGSSGAKGLAHRLHKDVSEALETRKRGLRTKTWPFLQYTEMPAVIAEPAFGSNATDAFRLLSRQPTLMDAYRTAICEWLDER